jgi:CPA2 family monovalent cation:H+ antiporter-2
MPSTHELADIAVVAVAALLCGLILTRLRQPAIVGYIIAGIILGPSGFALVEDRAKIEMLAELGVLLLLFLIGLRLSLRDFHSIWKIALMGAMLPLALSVALTLAASRLFDWPIELAVFLGFVISLSSTVVAIKMLEDIGELHSEVGRRTVGILIVQDLAVVPMLLVLNGMGGPEGFNALDLVPIAGAIALLALLIWYFGKRKRIELPFTRWTRSGPDLMPLAALTLCFAAAAVSGLLGLSTAYGAFLAGLLLGRTTARERLIQTTEPIQGVLMMVFALSVGLLIDLNYVWHHLGTVVLLLVLVVIAKTAVNIGVLRLLGEPWPRAFLTGTVLGQIGEFSFVLAAAGAASGLIDAEGVRLAVTVIAFSLIVSPIWLHFARRLHRMASSGVSGGDEILRGLLRGEARRLRLRSLQARRLARRMGSVVRLRRPRPAPPTPAVTPPPTPSDPKRDDKSTAGPPRPSSAKSTGNTKTSKKKPAAAKPRRRTRATSPKNPRRGRPKKNSDA